MTPASFTFTQEDLAQIRGTGLTPERILAQIEVFSKGFQFLTLDRPCTVGDGIEVLGAEERKECFAACEKASLSGRAMKFVPASGAASRMFKLLLGFNKGSGKTRVEEAAARAAQGDEDCGKLLRFMKGIKEFAFYEDLMAVMTRDGLNGEEQIEAGEFREILDYLVTPKGLNLANLPKGLIPFHRYAGRRSRTPFEEHLVEAAEYVRDKEGRARVHFTVSPEHEEVVRDRVERVTPSYEGPGTILDVEFSIQHPSTNTIAVDMENRPFRDERGRLVFRPGGHGALIGNLAGLDGDIVFIKNIDNVAPDSRKGDTYLHKKLLGGLLVLVQEKVFFYLEKLLDGECSPSPAEEAAEFAGRRFRVSIDERLSLRERVDLLAGALHRPLRVCGMVKNQGEPGGGPFWVRKKDGTLSRQIVESSQVDMRSPEQRKIWNSSTHFNPVDLVCGLRDHEGKPFSLRDFVDPGTAFISTKSMGGRDLKALELPGLWNGAMAGWNTIFVEVPLTTFSPVKTVLDLLREEHQP